MKILVISFKVKGLGVVEFFFCVVCIDNLIIMVVCRICLLGR